MFSYGSQIVITGMFYVREDSPISEACKMKNLAIIDFIMRQPNLDKKSIIYLLNWACKKGYPHIVKFLLETYMNDINSNESSEDDNECYYERNSSEFDFNSLVALACKNYRFSVINILLEQPSLPQKSMLIALKWALNNYYMPVVDSILQNDKISLDFLKSAFQMAIETSNLYIVEYFISHPERIDLTSENIIEFIISNALKMRSTKLLKYVVANNKLKKSDIETIFLYCCEHDYKSLLSSIINNDNIQEFTDENGKCQYLKLAYQSHSMEVFLYLLTLLGSPVDKYYSTIHSAINDGNLPYVKLLYDYDLVEATDMVYDYDCRSKILIPLHTACKASQFPIIKYLVEIAKVDINAADENCNTCLHIASKKGNIQLIKYLLQQTNIQKDAKNQEDMTPLHIACYYSKFDAVKCLVEEGGVDLKVCDKANLTPFAIAYTQHDHPILEYLKSVMKIPPPPPNLSFKFANLIEREDLESIKYLVEYLGYDVERKITMGQTPLHIAVNRMNLAIVKYFIEEHHANIEIEDEKGMTPFLAACARGDIEIIKYIYEVAHANAQATANHKFNALHIACIQGNFPLFHYLIQTVKLDPNNKDNDGETSLHIACHNSKSIDIVKYLVQEQLVNIEETDSDGLTPFLTACSRGNFEAIQFLIDSGANIHAKSRKGSNALHFVWNNMKLLQFLIEKGVEMNIENSDGEVVKVYYGLCNPKQRRDGEGLRRLVSKDFTKMYNLQ